MILDETGGANVSHARWCFFFVFGGALISLLLHATMRTSTAFSVQSSASVVDASVVLTFPSERPPRRQGQARRLTTTRRDTKDISDTDDTITMTIHSIPKPVVTFRIVAPKGESLELLKKHGGNILHILDENDLLVHVKGHYFDQMIDQPIPAHQSVVYAVFHPITGALTKIGATMCMRLRIEAYNKKAAEKGCLPPRFALVANLGHLPGGVDTDSQVEVESYFDAVDAAPVRTAPFEDDPDRLYTHPWMREYLRIFRHEGADGDRVGLGCRMGLMRCGLRKLVEIADQHKNGVGIPAEIQSFDEPKRLRLEQWVNDVVELFTSFFPKINIESKDDILAITSWATGNGYGGVQAFNEGRGVSVKIAGTECFSEHWIDLFPDPADPGGNAYAFIYPMVVVLAALCRLKTQLKRVGNPGGPNVVFLDRNESALFGRLPSHITLASVLADFGYKPVARMKDDLVLYMTEDRTTAIIVHAPFCVCADSSDHRLTIGEMIVRGAILEVCIRTSRSLRGEPEPSSDGLHIHRNALFAGLMFEVATQIFNLSSKYAALVWKFAMTPDNVNPFERHNMRARPDVPLDPTAQNLRYPMDLRFPNISEDQACEDHRLNDNTLMHRVRCAATRLSRGDLEDFYAIKCAPYSSLSPFRVKMPRPALVCAGTAGNHSSAIFPQEQNFTARSTLSTRVS